MPYQRIASLLLLSATTGAGVYGVLAKQGGEWYFVIGVIVGTFALGVLSSEVIRDWYQRKMQVPPVLVEIPCWYCSSPVLMPPELIGAKLSAITCTRCHDTNEMGSQWTN